MRSNEILKNTPSKDMFTQEESKGFYIYKAIAILCVIAAHVSVIIENLGIWTFICSTFWAMMARIGVVIFFTTSGFFFSRTKGDSFNFWKKKLKF